MANGNATGRTTVDATVARSAALIERLIRRALTIVADRIYPFRSNDMPATQHCDDDH